MNTKRFIKVTPKGSGKFYVLTAQNATFYERQGATVEEPTESEILRFFPELKPTAKVAEWFGGAYYCNGRHG